MKSTFAVILTVLIISAGCSRTGRISGDILDMRFDTSDGEVVTLRDLSGAKATVLLFYSPECPLCINYSKTINELSSQFEPEGISFVMVYPGIYYDKQQIAAFSGAYGIRLPSIRDTANAIADAFRATVTPEAVIYNSEGNILYRGAIDNWAYAEGKKRQTPSEHFLRDALNATANDRTPSPASTKPIGCFIE